jgi:hypothetical protein
VFDRALSQILSFWNPLRLNAAFHKRARYSPEPKVDCQGHPDRASAHNDDLVPFLHSPSRWLAAAETSRRYALDHSCLIPAALIVASSGLGYRLNFYSTSYNTNGTFAMLLVMMALMMGLNALMVLLERYALRWRAEMTATIQPY